LKPENLVLETPDLDSNLKVIDFGTSMIFQPTKKMSAALGTVPNCLCILPL
jgi:calcium-dependent protein kinase